YNPNIVVGTLRVIQLAERDERDVPDSPRKVALEPGLNSFTFRQPVKKQEGSYTYQAEFQPEGVRMPDGAFVKGLAGDRAQNNRARTHVVARGERKILFVESLKDNVKDEHQFLIEQIRQAGKSKFKVYTILAEELQKDRDKLALQL